MYPSKSIKLVIIALLVIITGSVAFFLLKRRAEKPRPTRAGWRSLVQTFAGSGAPGVQDGTNLAQTQFQDPFGLALDQQGNLYISDAGESNRIRTLTREGALTTLAGSQEGFADGSGAAASFHTPSGLALDDAGNLYVADTGNNRIRRITPAGDVTTIAGNGKAGYLDGPTLEAQFNGPIGLALDQSGRVYVADSYNDRIRLITTDGQVQTLAGGAAPGYLDGPTQSSLFDTPCGIIHTPSGELLIADTGNDRLRRIKDGQVTTFALSMPDASRPLSSPLGLALTHDGFLYLTEQDHARVLQIAPDGRVYELAGSGSGFANGDGQQQARFNQPAGLALDADGALYVADSANYLVRKIIPADETGRDKNEGLSSRNKNGDGSESSPAAETNEVLPRLSAQTLNRAGDFPWPVDPQQGGHEVVATMGEVRGSYDGESRHHLHSGIDVQAGYGATVRVVHEEKVAGPMCNWGFGSLNEGLRVGLISYIHLSVGRNEKDEPLKSEQFQPVRDEQGKIARIRIKRGTRFRVGDPLGSVNRMYHVHLNFGPPGAEVNPLVLPLPGFSDHLPPSIERDGIQLFNQAGERLSEKRHNRLVLRGAVRLVVDAYDQVDGNAARRRLGLYRLGYQLLLPNETPARGFEQPRITMLFDRLPAGPEAVKIAYADESGITVYGSAQTRFLYEVTNRVRDGLAVRDNWKTEELPAGDYILRIIAADLAGNEATAGRDLAVTIER